MLKMKEKENKRGKKREKKDKGKEKKTKEREKDDKSEMASLDKQAVIYSVPYYYR